MKLQNSNLLVQSLHNRYLFIGDSYVHDSDCHIDHIDQKTCPWNDWKVNSLTYNQCATQQCSHSQYNVHQSTFSLLSASHPIFQLCRTSDFFLIWHAFASADYDAWILIALAKWLGTTWIDTIFIKLLFNHKQQSNDQKSLTQCAGWKARWKL